MSGQKKRRVKSTFDPSIIENWFNKLSSDEMNEVGDESEDEGNFTEKSDHDTESEQDILENETDEKVNDNKNNNFYLEKNKISKWKKNKPNSQIRVRSHNIITHLPGPKKDARNAKSEIDCLRLFINQNIIRLITISTNIYILKV